MSINTNWQSISSSSSGNSWHPKTGKDLIVLTLLLSVFFGLALGLFPLHTPDTARYAEIPREMVASGDYITPHLNGLKYFEKPPLFYWMQAVNIKLFGINTFSVNLANALMALLTCLTVYLGASKLYERRSGFAAAIVLATSIIFFAMDHFTTLDMALTFFLTSALLCFILGANAPPEKNKGYYLWFTYIAIGLAVMTKGLVGIIFPVTIIFLWLIVCHEWRSVKTYCLVSGLILFLLVAAPWHIVVQLKNPEFFRFYFFEQHFLRYFTSYAGRHQPWWFFPVVLVGGLYPWVVFLIQAIKFHLSRYRLSERGSWLQQHKMSLFFLFWAGIIYIFYSFSSSRLIPYILPVFPPLAILIGNYFAVHWEQKRQSSFTAGFYAFAIINIAIGIAFLWLPHLAVIAQSHNPWFISLTFMIAVLFIASGIITLVNYRCFGIALGTTSLVITMSLLFLCATPLLLFMAPKSTLPLAMILKPQLKPQDEVVSFANYYQDLPYYLERRITVVDYRGELDFGVRHHKAGQGGEDWMIDQKTLWQRWQSQGKGRMYMIMYLKDYYKLSPQLRKNIYFLYEYNDKILVSNRAPSREETQTTYDQNVPGIR